MQAYNWQAVYTGLGLQLWRVPARFPMSPFGLFKLLVVLVFLSRDQTERKIERQVPKPRGMQQATQSTRASCYLPGSSLPHTPVATTAICHYDGTT